MLKRLKIIWLWIEIRLSSLFKFIDIVEEHHIFLMAGGIAYNIILYLIPLMLVAVYLVNIFLGADLVTRSLVEFIEKVLPPNSSTKELLQIMLNEVNLIFSGSSIVGWVGIFVLIWLSSTLLSSIRSGLNRIFGIETPKVYFFYKFKDIILVLLLMVLMTFSSYLIPMYSILKHIVVDNVDSSYQWYFSQVFATGTTLLMSFIMFFSIYKFLPNDKIPNLIVLVSTLICVIAVELSRNVFAWYIVKFGTYGKFYGTYAVLVSVAVWIYYLTLIMLFAAELSKFLYDKIHEKKRTKIINKLLNVIDKES